MAKPQWVLDLEAKHGLPYLEIPGTIYTLCYDPPVIVRSVSRNYAGPSPVFARGGFESATPIRHYVGWTQQADPRKRISRHHRAATPVTVTLSTGTMLDEDHLQQTGHCPTCGGAFADSLAV
ncbi:hypothetical protein [uncultured Friedmanniella sp.]|uniref:hypothetical protein n=1 Tax=uncultured Friedmanniella sp. TaxID=335381 RepID=UPI0035CB6422